MGSERLLCMIMDKDGGAAGRGGSGRCRGTTSIDTRVLEGLRQGDHTILDSVLVKEETGDAEGGRGARGNKRAGTDVDEGVLDRGLSAVSDSLRCSRGGSAGSQKSSRGVAGLRRCRRCPCPLVVHIRTSTQRLSQYWVMTKWKRAFRSDPPSCSHSGVMI
jgi:hypothetical protein